MEAGQKASVSPYFLSARSKQEVGLNGSGSTSGTYPGYVGYFNFYSIGANDSAGGRCDCQWFELCEERGLPICGLGQTHICQLWAAPSSLDSPIFPKGQNTSYTQKFNVVYPNSSSKYFTHQYQTAVFAPNTEATTIYNAYKV